MNFDRLAAYLQSLPEKLDLPGLDCIVYKDHREVFRQQAGWKDAARKMPVSDKDIYWLYSATKPITAAAVLQLIEQGKMALDDPVSRFLPEYKDITVHRDGGIQTAENTLTLRQLLSMTGGLSYDLSMPSIHACKTRTENQAATREMVTAFAKESLSFEPGTHYQYSLCHDVLAAVVEVVSGMKYSEYLRQNIFTPLGMNDTGFAPTDEKLDRMADQYIWDGQNNQIIKMEKINCFRLSENYESGGAGLLGSVNDYIRFADALCNYGESGEGIRILKKESVELMRTNQLSPLQQQEFCGQEKKKKGYSYALGMRTKIEKVPENPSSPIGEFGWDSMGGAYVLMDTENRLAIFYAQHVLCWSYCYETIHMNIREMVYEGLNK